MTIFGDLAVKILKYPHPILLKPTAEVAIIGESLAVLARQMFAAMYEARGVGLSANQVGINQRMAVINPTGKPEDEMVLINPFIVRRSGRVLEEEGCLSFPEVFGKVARARSVTVEYTDLSGEVRTIEADEFLARIFQHEIDHLEGVVFINKMTPAARTSVTAPLKKLEKEFESSYHKTGSD